MRAGRNELVNKRTVTRLTTELSKERADIAKGVRRGSMESQKWKQPTCMVALGCEKEGSLCNAIELGEVTVKTKRVGFRTFLDWTGTCDTALGTSTELVCHHLWGY